MRPDTQRSYHFGVNFVVAPAATPDYAHCLAFQQSLASRIAFDQSQRTDSAFVLNRANPPLQVSVIVQGPVSQLLIVAPNPNRVLEDFIEDAEFIIATYRETWPGEINVVRRDGTVRYLYAVKAQHAMQFLWEQRLGHSGDEMKVFARPVLGGGIRLVFPSRQDIDGDATMELKVESLLQDPRQLFVEVQGVWESRSSSEPDLDVRGMLGTLAQFASGPVREFILLEPPNA